MIRYFDNPLTPSKFNAKCHCCNNAGPPKHISPCYAQFGVFIIAIEPSFFGADTLLFDTPLMNLTIHVIT